MSRFMSSQSVIAKTRMGIILGASLLMSLISFTASAQTLTYGAPVTLDTAKKIAVAAAAEAKKNNFTMVIAIVDSTGTLTYLEKIDGTQLASVDIAIGKARTANNFKRPTKALEDAVAGGRNVLLSLPNAVLIEGGIPLVVDGKIIGAIGVSGGTSQQDAQVATAGTAVLPSPPAPTPATK